MERAHEPQPCELLKCTPITAKIHPHPLDETPGGADEIVEGRREKKKSCWRSFLHFFRRRAGKYDLAKAEKVNQSEAESYRSLTDDQTSLQHTPTVEIHDHKETPASEVLPAVEELLEQDVLGLIKEDLNEFPVSEVLITAEEQPEQDVHQPQDVDGSVSSSEDEQAEELETDQISLQQVVEIPHSEVLTAAEEQLEQDNLQPEDSHTPVSLIEEALQEGSVSEVPISAEEQLEQDVLQLQDSDAPVSSSEDDQAEELETDQTSLQQIVEIHDHEEPSISEVLSTVDEHLEQDVLQPQDVHSPVNSTGDDEVEESDNSHIFWRYEFAQKLGEGGNGCVHAGTRCKDGLKVAVKIAEKMPHMQYIRVPGHPRLLPIEIGLTLMANKGPSVPEIIKLLDWQEDPDHYVMVLERPMPSMSMFNFVKLRRRLDEGMAQHFMRQIIHAAKICCERGVFHRDIKMENLLVNPDTLEVKLIDFGCGALMMDSAYVAFNGTKMFCPPEFDVDGRYHAKPATVWSLGILLFVMVCGYYPDDKDLHMISKNDWSNPDLSQECCQMICSCLQSDPQRRLILEEMQLHDWFKVME
ncbi:serine threonine- kinase pim-1-like protein [Labeo rohita]|uniref:non-specific serine/threonine protein kinase n=2 Tax=Labeo rohita TaxID=84645 RepID=A0A498M905_LABRO|nr:serine threonine- kinase pim-1-like protein [Labeo rohita]RXN16313.1 serine threonine- kinase pim-1-like protein [Labeo rohita]